MITADPRSSATLSRYCSTLIATPSFVEDPEGATVALLAWAGKQAEPPVVFYQGDHDLLAMSRYRRRLAPHIRCVLPPENLVEDLVDKLRFAALAERLALPVPPTLSLRRGASFEPDARRWDRFPCVLKPAMRTHWFGSALQLAAIGTTQKALRIESRGELEHLLPLLATHETDFIVQAAIEGGEERILSYHAYVRPGGEVVAEFTGKKVRTSPRRYGVSTYVEITDDPTLKQLGRRLLERLGFCGVLKMDFKQSERDAQIYLLEINPRFNLWHHPATVAGLCLPELFYRDCIEPGSARASGSMRVGVRWISPREDRRALDEYRAVGEISLARWFFQIVTADVNEDFTLRDPLPGLAEIVGIAKRKLGRVVRASAIRRETSG
jgi:predicted ATP-grasp superfamily ATP-dependent carboligase